ncbi:MULTISPECIES: DM13 domain-containing protein [unclassified Nocardiopsis]|uniref:DM13 domain-containing protein n=1 Tax=unclassified Nocardiopsis TaxID=2649073 RepID=UPI000AADA71A|nr:DM13 domain-containing protein [Nocardiopsis sp. TSRI0078]
MAIGLWAFQPWRLLTSRTVREAPPVAAPSAPAESAESSEPGEEAGSDEDTGPVVLGEGGFLTQEHGTSGTATVLEPADGSRHVRLTDLATSDGPDLHVWITDQEAGGDWSKYRDGRHVALGPLKGDEGDADYEILPEADLGGMTSVVIWCDRFSVAFGSAPVRL